MKTIEKYICESCGEEIELDMDVRTGNSRYSGELVHRVPVCYCQILEKENMLSDYENENEQRTERMESLFKELREHLKNIQILMDNKKYADSRKLIAKLDNILKAYN